MSVSVHKRELYYQTARWTRSWSQVADMKLNDSKLDLCSGSHLTNSISPCYSEAMVFTWSSGPSGFCIAEEIRYPEQQLGGGGKNVGFGAQPTTAWHCSVGPSSVALSHGFLAYKTGIRLSLCVMGTTQYFIHGRCSSRGSLGNELICRMPFGSHIITRRIVHVPVHPTGVSCAPIYKDLICPSQYQERGFVFFKLVNLYTWKI